MTIYISPSQPGDWWTAAEVEDGFAPHDARPLSDEDPDAAEFEEAGERWERLQAGEHIRSAFDRD